MNKLPLQITTILLCGGSLFCSVGLWVSQQNTALSMLLAGVFAVSLEMCKFLFFPVARKQWGKNKLSSLLIYLLSFLLLIVSITATVAFLETGTEAKTQSSITSSQNYKLLVNEINSLDIQITTINNLMTADLKNGYRKRAYSKTKEIENLRALKTKNIAQLAEIKPTKTNGIHNIFNAIAVKTNSQAKQVRMFAYSIIAVLIDICGIVCLLIISGVTNQKETTVTTIKRTVSSPLQQKQKQHLKRESKGCNAETLKQKIVAGEFGNKPVMRKIIATEKVRHEELKKIFIELISEGSLIRKGNSAFLARQSV